MKGFIQVNHKVVNINLIQYVELLTEGALVFYTDGTSELQKDAIGLLDNLNEYNCFIRIGSKFLHSAFIKSVELDPNDSKGVFIRYMDGTHDIYTYSDEEEATAFIYRKFLGCIIGRSSIEKNN